MNDAMGKEEEGGKEWRRERQRGRNQQEEGGKKGRLVKKIPTEEKEWKK